jgi:hypothetical protein
MLEVDISLNIINEKMMKMSEITASTTLLNTADKCDELVKERKKREQLSKQQQQLVQLQRT